MHIYSKSIQRFLDHRSPSVSGQAFPGAGAYQELPFFNFIIYFRILEGTKRSELHLVNDLSRLQNLREEELPLN